MVPADGDGCDALCLNVEALYECPTVGQPCNFICGNSALDSGEQCDNGVNDNSYGTCSSTCQLAPRCGDNITQGAEGEDCDTLPNDGSYGTCRSNCTFAPHCGDGLVTDAETCDDGEATPSNGDGCSSTCQDEGTHICRTPGQLCDVDQCNDGVVQAPEVCDDANNTDGDGCEATCSQIETGWICPTEGAACVAASCGDGVIAGFEECDDGNALAGDGCDDRCEAEEGFDCVTPGPGNPCIATTCGNGVGEGLEECDDGPPAANGDGCDDTCKIEIGFDCPPAGGACFAVTCGNGTVEGAEQCDDAGNANPGCDALCQLESGYHCPTPGAQCVATVCPNGVVEGLEACDDNNLVAGDGCNPVCEIESIFECDPSQNCGPICGDGITLTSDRVPPGATAEECDDGNLQSGDGCSAACTVEAGYACTDFSISFPPSLQTQIVVRDFRGNDETGTGDGYPGGAGHVDFETYSCDQQGLVQTDLGSDGLPVLAATLGCITSSDSFDEWYRDVPNTN